MSHMGLARVLLAAVALCTGPAYSASAPGEASAFVRELGNDAIRVLSTKELNLAEREAKLQAVLYTNFDVPIYRFRISIYPSGTLKAKDF